MEEIKIGDVVQLKSGGPLLTVEELINDDSAMCVWFYSAPQQFHRFERAIIKLIALVKSNKK